MKKILFILSLLLIPVSAQAADFYVSTTGSGSTCSIASPCAASYAFANAVAGDTWYFRGGTYAFPSQVGYEYGSYSIAHSGTEANPIIFKAYTGETPIWRGNYSLGTANEMAVLLDNGSNAWIVIDGFTVDCYANGNSSSTQYWPSIAIRGGDVHVTIQNCIFYGASVAIQDNHRCIWIDRCNYVTVRKCEFRNFIAGATNNDYSATACVYAEYTTGEASNVTVEYNRFVDCSVCYYGKNVGAQYVTFRYNWCDGVEWGFAGGDWNDNYLYVYHNVIRLKRLTSNNRILHGVYFKNNSTDLICDDYRTYNNTIYSADTGSNGGIGGRGTHHRIYNNIIKLSVVGDSEQEGVFWFATEASFQEFDHNQLGNSPFYSHIEGSDYTTVAALEAANITLDTTNPCSTRTPCGNLASNPLFVNASGTYANLNDFCLQATSPCNNAGRDASDMGADIDMIASNLRTPVTGCTTILPTDPSHGFGLKMQGGILK